jgi:hypothetical protein
MLYIAIVRYTLSIAGYAVVVCLVMAITAASGGEVGGGGVGAWIIVAALITLHLAVGFAVGRWSALWLVVLLPILAIPVPTATDCGDGCEPWPMWFGMLYLGVPVGATLIAIGVGWRKTLRRPRSGAA